MKYRVHGASTHGNIPQERDRTFIVALSDLEMMNRFEFPEEIPLTVGVNDILDRSFKQNDTFYYPPGNKYYGALNRKIPDKTGIYRIDDSGVATRKYTLRNTYCS